MPLKLTIASYQRLSPGQETKKILDQGTLSIGRAAQNDWVLQDPERILSKNHCTVTYRDGVYCLTDLSVNGTFLNDSGQRIVRNETVTLQDGDHFILGEYEISVALLPDDADLAETGQAEPLTDIMAPSENSWSLMPGSTIGAEREAAGLDVAPDLMQPSFSEISVARQSSHEPLDPARSTASVIVTEPPLDRGGPEGAHFEPPALAPETPPLSPPDDRFELLAERPPGDAEPTAEPNAEPLIPEDWWMTPSPAPASAAPIRWSDLQAPEKSAAAPFQPPAQPMAQPQEPLFREHAAPPHPTPHPVPTAGTERGAPDAALLLSAFFAGAGLPPLQLTAEQWPQVMTNLGAIFHETIQSLIEILLARSDVKGEFGVERTSMGPVENNPLKTPPGRPPLRPEEAMTLLLMGRKEAYMSPVQAVREGFNDIKAHQLAVMAGIQSALSGLLARFDPHNLETHLEQSMLGNLWLANRKAKYWDLFTAEYQTIVREAEDDFNKLFGDEFARAYEAHSFRR